MLVVKDFSDNEAIVCFYYLLVKNYCHNFQITKENSIPAKRKIMGSNSGNPVKPRGAVFDAYHYILCSIPLLLPVGTRQVTYPPRTWLLICKVKLVTPLHLHSNHIIEISKKPWLVCFSGFSAGLWTTGLLVQFPVRVHAWVAGQAPNRGLTRGNHTLLFLSLPPSFPFSLHKSQHFIMIIVS